jgi:hypothetical protein
MVTLRKNKGSALTYDEMDQNQVEAAHRVAGSSISEDLSLSGKQSSILIGDDITIASGKTVTLRDSASIDIINPEDAKSLSLRKPIQAPGSIVQVQYYQITATNTVRFTVGNTGVATAMQVDNISSASRITLPNMVPGEFPGVNNGVFSVVITPKYSNSVIKIEAMVNGEWTDDTYTHKTGWGFARQVDGGMTFLKADPFETRLACVAPTSRSYFGDNDASTPECANYSYFDIPNTTKSIRYHVTCLGTNSNTFRVNRTADDGSDHQRFTSFISATEIAQ